MIIPRDRYLNKLSQRKQNGMIKVVTGMRRAGGRAVSAPVGMVRTASFASVYGMRRRRKGNGCFRLRPDLPGMRHGTAGCPAGRMVRVFRKQSAGGDPAGTTRLPSAGCPQVPLVRFSARPGPWLSPVRTRTVDGRIAGLLCSADRSAERAAVVFCSVVFPVSVGRTGAGADFLPSAGPASAVHAPERGRPFPDRAGHDVSETADPDTAGASFHDPLGGASRPAAVCGSLSLCPGKVSARGRTSHRHGPGRERGKHGMNRF